MPEKSEFVKVAVEPKRKDRWDEAVSDNPNVGTMSGLVRLAVEREIGEKPDEGGAGEEVAEAMSELVEQHRQVNNRLEALEARLGTIEQEVQDDPGVNALASDVFAALPTKEQVEEDALPDRLPAAEGGPTAHSGEVDDIAAVLDASELQVGQALEKLQNDTARVRTDGTTYWKEV